uniref:thioredoxin family protein n=1 Tax=Flavobacterium sp. TaxID=239 RepID=UPI00404AE9A5
MKKDLFQIIESENIVLIEFVNANCEPCAMIEPTLQQVKNALGNRVEIIVIAIDEVPEFVKMYAIEMAPTIICFQNGELIWKTSDVLSKQEILEKILDIV